MSDEKRAKANLFEKLARKAKVAGEALVEHTLCIFYAAQEPTTPMWAKTAGYAAIAYFVSPVDAIPDFLPGGYADDLGVVVTAYASLTPYVTEEMRSRAKAVIHGLFGGS